MAVAVQALAPVLPTFDWHHEGSPDLTDPAVVAALPVDLRVCLSDVGHRFAIATPCLQWKKIPGASPSGPPIAISLDQEDLDWLCMVGGLSTAWLRTKSIVLFLSHVPTHANGMFAAWVGPGGLDLDVTYRGRSSLLDAIARRGDHPARAATAKQLAATGSNGQTTGRQRAEKNEATQKSSQNTKHLKVKRKEVTNKNIFRKFTFQYFMFWELLLFRLTFLHQHSGPARFPGKTIGRQLQNNWQTTGGTQKRFKKVFFTKERLGRTWGTYPRWASTRKDGFEDSGFVTGGGGHPSDSRGEGSLWG